MKMSKEEVKALKIQKAAEKLTKKAMELKTKADKVGVKKAVKNSVKEAKVSKNVIKKSVKKFLIKDTKKKIANFYSAKNLKAIEKLIVDDYELLKGPDFVEVSVVNNPQGRITRVPVRATRQTVNVSPEVLKKLENLHYFDLYEEYSLQKDLNTKYPNIVIVNNAVAKKFNDLGVKLETLRREVSAVYSRKKLENVLKEKLDSISKNISLFKDAHELLK